MYYVSYTSYYLQVNDSEKVAQFLIDEAMELDTLHQKNVVGVITGPAGTGKTTLLHRLFGIEPPNCYTNTGAVGQWHHILHHSAATWSCLSHSSICELLAPLIKARTKISDVDMPVTRHMIGEDQYTTSTSVSLQLCFPRFNGVSLPWTNEIMLTLFYVWNIIQRKMSSSTSNLPVPVSMTTSSSREILTIITSKSPTCQEMVPLVKSPATPTMEGLDDLQVELVHMINTGSQPELMEVMPSLIHNANLAMVLVNLKYGLNECPPVNYRKKRVAYKRTCQSRYTSREVILKLVSTLHGKKFLKEQFRILIVATHRDCVEGDLETRVEALNSELRSLLLPAFENELILFEQPNKIAFVLDLKNPDNDDKRTLDQIQELFKNHLKKTVQIQMPTSYLAFEQDLVKFAENEVKRDILSFEECRRVGAPLKMSHKMVVAALDHFHCQNTFLYFRQVLPNHVFIKLQVPLDIIKGIVHFSDKKLQCVPAKLVRLLKDGIITEELLSYDQISPHFKEGFFEVKHAIKLFCHTFTIAPLDNIGKVSAKERHYLMMCLKPAIPDHKLHHHLPQSSETDPLVVKFSSGYVPLGCFGSTISCLLSKYRWEVVRKSDGSPKCLARNIVTLYAPDLLVDVTLIDFTQSLEIHTARNVRIRKRPSNPCSLVQTTVFGAIEKALNKMILRPDDVKISAAAICSCQETSERHFATFEKHGDRYFLRCPLSTTEPVKRQCLWMGDAMDNSRPTLPQLMQLKIPEKVGPNYRKFGTFLLQDDTGCVVQSMETNYHHQPEDIVNDILRRWLQKEPTPVTWDNLVRVLRDCDLQPLAEYIRKTIVMHC